MTDDLGIEMRVVDMAFGDVVCRARLEEEGGVVFPVPSIDPIPCAVEGRQLHIVLSVEAERHANNAVLSRDYVLDDVVSFRDMKGRRFGYVFIEDGLPSHVQIEADFGDTTEKHADMLALTRVLYATETATRINDALAELEGDCLAMRAAAVREAAAEMIREAILLDDESRHARSRVTSPRF